MLQRRRRPARPAAREARPTVTHRAPTVRTLSNFVWPPCLRAFVLMVSRVLRRLRWPPRLTSRIVVRADVCLRSCGLYTPAESLTPLFSYRLTHTVAVYGVGLNQSTDPVERRGAGRNQPGRVLHEPLMERENVLRPATVARATLPQRNDLGLALSVGHRAPATIASADADVQYIGQDETISRAYTAVQRTGRAGVLKNRSACRRKLSTPDGVAPRCATSQSMASGVCPRIGM